MAHHNSCLKLGSTNYEGNMHHSSSHLTRNVRHIEPFICLHIINLLNGKYQKEPFLRKVENNSILISEHTVCNTICYLMQIHKLI